MNRLGERIAGPSGPNGFFLEERPHPNKERIDCSLEAASPSFLHVEKLVGPTVSAVAAQVPGSLPPCLAPHAPVGMSGAFPAV